MNLMYKTGTHKSKKTPPSTGTTGPNNSTSYWIDTSGVTGPSSFMTDGSIAIGSSNVAIGNIAYGSYTMPTTGSYITVGGGIPLTSNFSSYGNYTFPGSYSVYNDENQNTKIEKLEERIKELESKMEKLLEIIEDKTVYKISI